MVSLSASEDDPRRYSGWDSVLRESADGTLSPLIIFVIVVITILSVVCKPTFQQLILVLSVVTGASMSEKLLYSDLIRRECKNGGRSSGWDMSEQTPQNRAIEELEQFGLREYEAKCFVSLTKITAGTAREVSEHIDVPRTRVYEAVRSLESNGLVEIQHSSPQRFRAIPVSEAVQVLEQQHKSRIERLEQSLRQLKQTTRSGSTQSDPEIWSLAGSETITTRAKGLIDGAESEILLLFGDEQAVSPGVNDRLVSATNRDVDVVVGASSASLRRQVTESTPEILVFDSNFDWLTPSNPEVGLAVGRLLLVDDKGLLASTVIRSDGEVNEQAVCGNGSNNGLVYVLQGLLSQHLDYPSRV
jgi:sugar-specific transcriptional regulator TrmB